MRKKSKVCISPPHFQSSIQLVLVPHFVVKKNSWNEIYWICGGSRKQIFQWKFIVPEIIKEVVKSHKNRLIITIYFPKKLACFCYVPKQFFKLKTANLTTIVGGRLLYSLNASLFFRTSAFRLGYFCHVSINNYFLK